MLRKNDKAKRRGLFFAVAAAALMISAIALTGCNDSDGEKKATASAKPGGSPTVVSDVSQSLEQFKGKVVLLDLWATWCPPCKAEIPWFMDLQKTYGEDLVVLGVSMDEDGWNAVRPFIEQRGVNYPVMLSNDEMPAEYRKIESLPTTYLIDRKGRIAGTHSELGTKAMYEEWVKKIL